MIGFFSFLHDLFACDGVMMGIAPIIGAAALSTAASIGNAIFGSISANRQKRKQLEAIRKAQAENRNWYNRRYNEDATQRADAQRMMTRANEAIRKRTQAAAGRQAVMGGTDATLAATQEANAEAMGNAVSDIAAEGERRKDAIEASYRARQQQLEDQKSGVEAAAEEAKRTATATAATGAVNAMAGVIANSGDTNGAAKVKGVENSAGSQVKTTIDKALKSPDLGIVTPEDPWKKAKRTPIYGSDNYWT